MKVNYSTHTILHVFFAPATVKFDKANIPAILPVNENELANGIRVFLESCQAAGRETVFHGGGWQTRAIHSEAAIRSIYRELRSEPSIIVETFAEGRDYHIHFAFWAEHWPDFRYKRVFSFSWREVLAGYATETTQKYQAMGLSEEDFKDFYGEKTLKAYKHNLSLMEKEARVRKVELPEKDIQRNIRDKYQPTVEDMEKLHKHITLYHNIGTGLLLDEYHLLHAGTGRSRPPLLPHLLSGLMANAPEEERKELYGELVQAYKAMYACLEEDQKEADTLHLYLLDLAQACLQMAHHDEAVQALQKSAWYFFVLRNAQLPERTGAALYFFTQEASFPYLTQEDREYTDRLAALVASLQVFDGFRVADFEKALAEHKALEERKLKEEEARKAEQARKAKEARRAKIKALAGEFVKVKAGTFTMGCTSEQGDDCWNSEKPTHRVTLTNDYLMGKYPVTRVQWRAVMGNNPSEFKNCDNCPVESVSWNDIQEFLVKLNQQTGTKGTGKCYRLPTEAEWEYAARGGVKSRGYKYAGSNDIDEVAWYDDNSGGKTHPLGQKASNELGLYDMSGNVDEWCADWYGAYSSSSQTNPKGPSSGQYRVLRGGSWINFARECRVSTRSFSSPGSRGNYNGFRLCLSL